MVVVPLVVVPLVGGVVVPLVGEFVVLPVPEFKQHLLNEKHSRISYIYPVNYWLLHRNIVAHL